MSDELFPVAPDPHEGPLFDDDEAVKDFLQEVETHTAIAGEVLVEASAKANMQTMAGESFALWLAAKLPDQFGGDKTPDPLTAYLMLQELRHPRDDK